MTHNKTVFITGASSGIGEATAEIFAANHFNLILNARRSDRLEKIKAELEKKYSVKILLSIFDVRKLDEVKNAIKNIPTEWQKIDVLINNAGLASGMSTIDEGDTDDWDKMIDTNIKGLLYVTRNIVPLMIKNNSGHIVNIGSIAGKEVYANGNVYCSTKFAVDALTKSMRIDLLKHDIKVTGIHPGAVETEFSIVRFHGDVERAKKVYDGFDNLVAADIADAIWYAVSRPKHVNINELTIMPTAQAQAGIIQRK
ncbi:MAG: SDR family NAD(P)-dependent oxidoreductase [Bacteroidota bacterium]